MYLYRTPYKHVLIICLYLSIASSTFAGEKVLDLLNSPAMISDKAFSSVLLSVVKAGSRLVTVGERGIVLLSDDDGITWRQVKNVPVSVTLTNVFFPSAKQGWAIGHSGVVIHTNDGGESWTLQLDGNKAAHLTLEEAQASIELKEPGAKKALNNAQYLIKEGPDKPFLGIHFSNEHDGIIVGAYGLALSTGDGGKTWRSIATKIPNNRGNHLYAIAQNKQQIVIVGEQGTLFTKGVNQDHFRQIKTPYQGSFFGAQLFDDTSMLVYGLRGNIWRSNGLDATWKQIKHHQESTITSGTLSLNDMLVLADEGGRLFLSADKGSNFFLLSSPSVSSITDLIIMNDTIIATSLRGVNRIPFNTDILENK